MRTTTSKLAPLGSALLVFTLSACADANSVEGFEASEGRCATCHLSSAADAAGASGAHVRHLTAGTLGGPFACSACHPVPASVAAPGHDDGTVDVVGFSTTQQSCAIACHGAAAPVWTRTDGTQARCGSCHGLPPAAGHPGINPAAGCGACHPSTVRNDGTIDVAAGAHVNGNVEFLATPPCGACHGIPPTTGLHVLHVEEQQLSCGECHPGATSTAAAPGHPNGAVEIVFPGWRATRTCTNSCHGAERW